MYKDIISYFRNEKTDKMDMSKSHRIFEKRREENQEPVKVEYEKLHFLIIDDYAAYNEINKNELTEGGAKTVRISSDGREALELFKLSEIGFYDVILTDIIMPELNGYNMAQEIRRLNRADAWQVIIIALTAHLSASDEKRLYDSGIDAYTDKPLELEKLTEILKKYLKNN